MGGGERGGCVCVCVFVCLCVCVISLLKTEKLMDVFKAGLEMT